jgi:LmbE family N-acetylglucosaminyl deacetylase
MIDKKVLYVGAHPDDVFISSGISIHRDLKNSHVITISSGVEDNMTVPITRGNITFQSNVEYLLTRFNEDLKAFQELGLPTKNYENLVIPDIMAYQHLDSIINKIMETVKKLGIEKLVTHEFPQSHPDHEVASFCSHFVGNILGIPVWEYPMYGIRPDGKEVDFQFLSNDHDPIVSISYTLEEFILKDHAIRNYQTQSFIIDRFRRTSEVFGRVKRDFTFIPQTTYFYRSDQKFPSTEEIRSAFMTYLSNSTK